MVRAVFSLSMLTSLNGLGMGASSVKAWDVRQNLSDAEMVFLSRRLAQVFLTSRHILSDTVRFTRLDLSRCGLADFPESILTLVSLERLNLSHNPLRHVPVAAINKMHSLAALDLSDCPHLVQPPKFAACRGAEKTLQYLRGCRPASPCRLPVILLGDSDQARADLAALLRCPGPSHAVANPGPTESATPAAATRTAAASGGAAGGGDKGLQAADVGLVAGGKSGLEWPGETDKGKGGPDQTGPGRAANLTEPVGREEAQVDMGEAGETGLTPGRQRGNGLDGGGRGEGETGLTGEAGSTPGRQRGDGLDGGGRGAQVDIGEAGDTGLSLRSARFLSESGRAGPDTAESYCFDVPGGQAAGGQTHGGPSPPPLEMWHLGIVARVKAVQELAFVQRGVYVLCVSMQAPTHPPPTHPSRVYALCVSLQAPTHHTRAHTESSHP